MTEKTITLCGKDVKLLYCAAAENAFEEFSGKSIAQLRIDTQQDLLHLALGCIVAAYSHDGQDAPLSSKELLYDATPQELTGLFLTVINMRNDWYGVTSIVEQQLKQENDQLTEEEKAEAEKNAQAPTTAI